MAEDSGDKSEEPTPHRLREARQKGQVAKSKEITVAVALFFTYLVFRYVGGFMFSQISDMVRIILGEVSNGPNLSLSMVAYILVVGVRGMVFAVGPIAIVAFLAALFTEAAQTGFVIALDPLSPKLERINPLEGFKRLVSIQGLVEIIKSILKILIVFYIAFSAVREDLDKIIILMDTTPWDVIVLGGSLAYKIAIRVALFYVAIAILDYFFRRWEFMRKMKMTRQEIKEEYKRLEGDPQVKQRMRDLQRQAAYQRMMSAVPQADVVVTNPTHIAVALKYVALEMTAPLVLAKGERKIAEEIKKVADEAEVPIVENEPLARSIFRTTNVNQEVPADLFQAVAEVLAYVFRLKRIRKEKKRGGPLNAAKRYVPPPPR